MIMPWNKVMNKWGKSQLHSGSKNGPLVKNQKQAVAIMLSEKKKAATNPEYASPLTPSDKFKKRMKLNG